MFSRTGFFAKSNIHKQKDNQKKRSSNLCIGTNIQKVIHSASNIASIFTEANKNIIPKSTFHVNIASVFAAVNGVKLGVINVSAKYPAEKLINNPENTRNQDLVKNRSIKLLYHTIYEKII